MMFMLLNVPRFRKHFSDRKSLETLRLNLCNVDLVDDLLPFLQQLKQLAPKLDRLELVIEATTEMVSLWRIVGSFWVRYV
jgi:hypothetical protein